MAKDKKDAIDSKTLDEIEVEQEEPTEAEAVEEQEKAPEAEGLKPKKQSWLKRLFATKKRKVFAGIIGVLLILGILYAVPVTRYGILGTFVKKNVRLIVTDAETKKPVSRATIALAGKSATTSEKGEAELKGVPVGDYQVKITKNYYKDASSDYTVPVFGDAKKLAVKMTATGRQVEIKVSNIITKAVLAKASIKVSGTSAITDDKGMATIVLPADKKTLDGTVSLNGYNDKKVTIQVTEQADKNNFALTPEGSLYYLSNQTGTINVMKANLDGSGAKTVVTGTGNEDGNNTALLAARDWKYLALFARRTSDADTQLYLVNAQTGVLTLIDKGDNVGFNLVGWSGHRFIYQMSRYSVKNWQSGNEALKSYDAETGKLLTIDQTTATGSNDYDYTAETIDSPYIVGDKVLYGKSWGRYYYSTTPIAHASAIMSINADGSQKTRLKEFGQGQPVSINLRVYEPQGIYFQITVNYGNATYYAYKDGALKSISLSDTKFYNTSYPTYLVSPSAKKVFWQEYRDGKNTLFVGDGEGKNAKTLANASDYSTYGWFGDDYVLLAKNNSELYIASSTTPISDTNKPLKITDYYKPKTTYPGYGYGYGGI